ncbi:MAG: hypothetical protein JNL98_05235 [Bryobacterales bacterium]|nr:hypothetical protein [Bryobacterales bacterium]
MVRTDIFLKVVVEHDDRERAEKLADELCRNLKKLYGVRTVEVASVVSHGGSNVEG